MIQLIFFVVSFIARAGEKVFHYLFIIALLVGTISYYAQASDLAWSVIKTSNQLQNGATRQIFFAKYVYWMMSFPVMSVALGLLSGISWATIFYNVTLCWIWYVSHTHRVTQLILSANSYLKGFSRTSSQHIPSQTTNGASSVLAQPPTYS